jgi:hypothetical protein
VSSTQAIFSLRYDEIKDYLQRMAERYPEFVRLTNEGTTVEGRDIMLVKIGRSTEGHEKRAIYIDSGKTDCDNLQSF